MRPEIFLELLNPNWKVFPVKEIEAGFVWGEGSIQAKYATGTLGPNGPNAPISIRPRVLCANRDQH